MNGCSICNNWGILQIKRQEYDQMKAQANLVPELVEALHECMKAINIVIHDQETLSTWRTFSKGGKYDAYYGLITKANRVLNGNYAKVECPVCKLHLVMQDEQCPHCARKENNNE